MIRPVRLAVAALVLFLAAAGAGVLVGSHWGPERARVALEGALGEALGAPVSVREAHLSLGTGALSWIRGVLLDAEGIEALRPGEAEPALAVDRLQARLDPLSLLIGRVRVRSVALDGLRVSLEAGPGAALAPAEASEPLVGWLETLAVSAERAMSTPLPGNRVRLERSELRIQGAADDEGAEPWTLHFHGVGGELRLGRPGSRASASLAGRVAGAGEQARLEIELARDRRGELRLGISVEELDLESAAPLLATRLPEARLGGRADLSLDASRAQPGVWRVAARVDARGLAGTLPRMGDGRPVPVEVARARAGVQLDVNPERLRIERAFAAAEGSELSLTGELERPLTPAAHTVGEVALDRYDLTRRDALIAFLPPRQIESLQAALEPLRSGHLEDVRIRGAAPLHDWLRAFDDDARGLLPESVEARARFTGFAVRAGEEETVTDLSGLAVWRGDRIELRGVRGRRAGHWMPVLDATLDGVSHLSANAGLPEVPDAGNAPLMLGLGPLYDIVVDPNRPPGEMPRALLLALDHVVHPTLVWPLRNLFARANPGEDGIRLLLEHAVWGRVPIRAQGLWAMQADGPRRVERVAVKIDVDPPLDGLATLDLHDPIWARGRWHLDAHNLGRWRVESSTGSFHARGQNVRLASYELELGIAGRALGEATIDFSDPEELPYWTTVRVVGAQAEGIVDKIGFEPDEARGEVVLDGQFHGELRPGRKVLAGMEGTLQVAARDGVILRRLPVVLAIAKATDTFNPFGSRDEMQFSEIDAALRFERGIVHADDFRINGSDVRLVATGNVDGLHSDHPMEAVVGIFFFKALDRVIGVVPVLSDLILGEDDNLMGAYVEISGAWAEPEASLVPMKTVASGPASFALEGVPRFVRRAITAIQSALARPDVAAPPPSPRGEDS